MPETNEELVKRVQAGDGPSCVLMLYNQNIGLIKRCARPFLQRVELDDLMQEAYLITADAARKYDPDGGTAFNSYLTAALINGFRRYANRCQAIREPDSRQCKNNRCRKLSNDLEQRTGSAPADGILIALGMDPDAVEGFRRSEDLAGPASLSAPVEDMDGAELADVIPDEADPVGGLIEDIDRARISSELWDRVHDLPEDEQAILQKTIIEGRGPASLAKQMHMSTATLKRKQDHAARYLSRCGRLRRLADGYLTETSAMYGGGAGSFNRTWTSSTERAALEDIRRREAAEAAQSLYKEIIDLLTVCGAESRNTGD